MRAAWAARAATAAKVATGSFAVLAAIAAPAALSAQLSIQPSLGLRYTSTLVHDSIVTGIDVRPALAPALAFSATTPIQAGWSAEAVVDFSVGGLDRHEGTGASVRLGTLTTLAIQFGFRRRLPAGLSGRVSVGGLKYFPSDRGGIFRAGAGGVFALGGAAASYALPRVRAGSWALGVEVRYDLHQFITPALRSQGFTTARTVHRVALAVRAGRSTS